LRETRVKTRQNQHFSYEKYNTEARVKTLKIHFLKFDDHIISSQVVLSMCTMC